MSYVFSQTQDCCSDVESPWAAYRARACSVVFPVHVRNDASVLQRLSSPPPSCHIWIWLLSSAPLSAVGDRDRGREGNDRRSGGQLGRCSLVHNRAEPRSGELEGHFTFSSALTDILHLLCPASVSPASSFFSSPSFPPLVLSMMSSSLLENPVQAILYLRELTTIVQNQQSLIQTQRSRIEELDRRVDELIGENRHLRDVRVQQHHAYHHHHHHHPDPSCLVLHHHPQDPQLKTGAGSLPDHASAPAQVEAAPVVEESPSQTMDPGDMQLVPADPSTVSPVESDPENGASCHSCRSLVPMTPTTLCRSLALSRKSEWVEGYMDVCIWVF